MTVQRGVRALDLGNLPLPVVNVVDRPDDFFIGTVVSE
jgi:hypothetical protein